MARHEFDPGYADEPFRSLAADYPGEEVYPAADFRVEWGPVFHRGRLDGSARVLVIGQDPAQHEVAYQRITHPTAPESAAGGDLDRYAEAMAAMLADWNAALERLAPAIRHRDADRELVRYGERLGPGDYAPIPERDLPAGLPAWMRSRAWADRRGRTATLKRATIVITVPPDARPWQ
jgi:hypothetical protein